MASRQSPQIHAEHKMQIIIKQGYKEKTFFHNRPVEMIIRHRFNANHINLCYKAGREEYLLVYNRWIESHKWVFSTSSKEPNNYPNTNPTSIAPSSIWKSNNYPPILHNPSSISRWNFSLQKPSIYKLSSNWTIYTKEPSSTTSTRILKKPNISKENSHLSSPIPRPSLSSTRKNKNNKNMTITNTLETKSASSTRSPTHSSPRWSKAPIEKCKKTEECSTSRSWTRKPDYARDWNTEVPADRIEDRKPFCRRDRNMYWFIWMCHDQSQVEGQVLDGSLFVSLSDILMDVLSHQFGQLLCTLQTSWHLYGPHPVGVVVALLESELGDRLVWDLRFVVGNYVLGEGRSALCHVLGCHVEIKGLFGWYFFEEDRAWGGVDQGRLEFATARSGVVVLVHSFGWFLDDHNVHDLRIVAWLSDFGPFDHLFNGLDFSSALSVKLLLCQSLPIKNNNLRHLLFHLDVAEFDPVDHQLLVSLLLV